MTIKRSFCYNIPVGNLSIAPKVLGESSKIKILPKGWIFPQEKISSILFCLFVILSNREIYWIAKPKFSQSLKEGETFFFCWRSRILFQMPISQYFCYFSLSFYWLSFIVDLLFLIKLYSSFNRYPQQNQTQVSGTDQKSKEKI